MTERIASVERVTKETAVRLTLNLDGTGRCEAKTGLGFFDHMLDGFARHGMFDLTLSCEGDLHVDTHHSIEDTGIVLGEAIKQALGDKKGIKRYGNFYLPMDETLILCAVDLSGRPYVVNDVTYTCEKLGEVETEMLAEFFYAVAYSAGMNLHLRKMSGANNHHIAEGCFKAFAKALDMATSLDPRVEGVWSTKGSL
ncbi:MAG: imidazoleglycerol-phosphate dehydratase HisB [Oscillospiraceae bacterium]|jgi:imidazoleglycerol-phosphate dehydratase|nr:imidazoleglycerol-phosphate dehydratase HisB [Oscillospiraceae bacterium]